MKKLQTKGSMSARKIQTENERQEFIQSLYKYKESEILREMVEGGEYEYILLLGQRSFVVVFSEDFFVTNARLGYVRVSTDTQTERGYGISRQIDQIIQYSKTKEYRICAIGFDLGISGANHMDLMSEYNKSTNSQEMFKEIRPALHYVLTNLTPKNKILSCEPSRLWRENDITGSMIRFMIMAAKSDLEFVDDPRISLWESNRSVYLSHMMIFNIADFDRASLKDKLRDGRERKALSGKNVTGKVAYGYYADEDGTEHICEPEADVIRSIAAMRDHGCTYRVIAETLNLRGVQKHSKKPWTVSDIQRILTQSPIYRGWKTYGEGVKKFFPDLVILPDN